MVYIPLCGKNVTPQIPNQYDVAYIYSLYFKHSISMKLQLKVLGHIAAIFMPDLIDVSSIRIPGMMEGLVQKTDSMKSDRANTNCISTATAVATYMCGPQEDENTLDHSTIIYDDIKLSNLFDYLRILREEETLDIQQTDGSILQYKDKLGSFSKTVLRISVVSEVEESDPPQQHTWTIIQQQDWRFLWLQSFIGQYTLSEWLDFLNSSRGSQYYSYNQITEKLSLLTSLMAIDDWTASANDAYYTLFHVNMNDFSSSLGGTPRHWDTKNRLRVFWKFVCDA